MALNTGKILMRRGQEVNFDPNKMTPGEWAVSLDSKFVRMCFQPGVCVRMATYDAFEADMVQIQGILAECKTIEEAVTRINDEISAKAQAVAEYTEQAKQYRDEAEQFRNQSFASTPEGYLELVEQVEENTRKIEEGVGGVSDYGELENKPKINNIELSGNKTLEELGVKPHALTNTTNNLLATEPGTPLDAVQGKTLYDMAIEMSVGRLPIQAKNRFATLEEFLVETTKNINIPIISRIQDSTGAWGPGGNAQWYKCFVVYQNHYGSQYSLGGNGFMWDDAGNRWSITITGNSNTTVNFKHEKLITETELNASFKTKLGHREYVAWTNITAGSYAEGVHRFTKGNIGHIKEFIFVLQEPGLYGGNSSAFEYVSIKTGYANLQSGYYQVITSKGIFRIYYKELEYLDIREIPQGLQMRGALYLSSY